MHKSEQFTHDFTTTPYWLDGLAPLDVATGNLPSTADLVVIGSGYTGLNAALVAARAGQQVVVLEAAEPGAGCSTRNGGQISAAIKPTFSKLAKRYGPEKAAAIQDEGVRSVTWLARFIQQEQIDCDYQACGSFHGAHSARQLAVLERDLASSELVRRSGGQLVDAAQLAQEIGTDRYHGGAIFPADASLDPARYHLGLLYRALQAGVAVHPHTPALSLGADKPAGVQPVAAAVRVSTPRGDIKARDVIVATNGYTGRATPWLQRRVIPVGSYIIATEPLEQSLLDRLMPTNRVICDTRKVVYYYRVSPDRQRIVFGGRVSAAETDPRVSAPRLQQELSYLFPELDQVRISHSWMGYVAFTFDSLPKCGQHRHIHYCLGYCGSGIALSSYLGMRTAQAVLGDTRGVTALSNLAFPTRPLYFGKPWFLGAAVKYYQWRDRHG